MYSGSYQFSVTTWSKRRRINAYTGHLVDQFPDVLRSSICSHMQFRRFEEGEEEEGEDHSRTEVQDVISLIWNVIRI